MTPARKSSSSTAASPAKPGARNSLAALIPRYMLGWFAGLFLALLICYSNHFANGFQFDDWHSVQYNPAIRSLSNVPKMFVDSTTFSVLRSAHSYRPVVTASLALDYALGAGLNPFWFHLSTFFWLLVLLAAMYVVCVDTFDRASPDSANHWTAWLAVAIYGLHPAGAETVNYIIQRGDLYVVLGIAAGIAMYASRAAPPAFWDIPDSAVGRDAGQTARPHLCSGSARLHTSD